MGFKLVGHEEGVVTVVLNSLLVDFEFEGTVDLSQLQCWMFVRNTERFVSEFDAKIKEVDAKKTASSLQCRMLKSYKEEARAEVLVNWSLVSCNW